MSQGTEPAFTIVNGPSSPGHYTEPGSASSLSPDEQERYLRQLLIFGEAGQQKLKNASIFIAGTGGLGSPVAYYLAAAGVGHLTIVDHDEVALSNMNRQILHFTTDIGRKKIDSATQKLRALNPEIEVTGHAVQITPENIEMLAAGADLIIDAVDNYEARYILNAYAVRAGIPFFHGAVRGISGQMLIVIPGETPCLRCLIGDCLVNGPVPVLGIAPGIIGLMQANEAVKYLTGTGTVAAGQLHLWDGERTVLESFTVKKDHTCPVCKNRG